MIGLKKDLLSQNNIILTLLLLFKAHKIKQNCLQSHTHCLGLFLPLRHSVLLRASERDGAQILTVDIVNYTSRDFPTALHRLPPSPLFLLPCRRT